MRVTYSLGQDIFTPEDIGERDLIKDDRPYAGWLYGGIGLTSENGKRLDTLELNLGIVGPYSLADETQDNWHKLIGIDRPKGWRNQLENEPGIVLYYERKWRSLAKLPVEDIIPIDDLAFDFTPHVGAALGNVFTYGAAGFTLRFGDDLPTTSGGAASQSPAPSPPPTSCCGCTCRNQARTPQRQASVPEPATVPERAAKDSSRFR